MKTTYRKSKLIDLYEERISKVLQMQRLKGEIQVLESHVFHELIEGNHTDCFSINWRAVARKVSKR